MTQDGYGEAPSSRDQIETSRTCAGQGPSCSRARNGLPGIICTRERASGAIGSPSHARGVPRCGVPSVTTARVRRQPPSFFT